MYNDRMSKRNIPRFSSIDMTLALGADSFIRERQPGVTGPSDPVGKACLSDLIDLVVNSEVCFLLRPSEDEFSSRPELVQGITAIKSIPDCAAIRLSEAAEKRVFREFWRTCQDFGHGWLSRWWCSQVWNPAVISKQLPRLGPRARSFTAITDQGWEVWSRYVSTIDLDELDLLSPTLPPQPHFSDDVRRAGSLVAYQYCYAYDVFRRGWQYAEAARRTNLDIQYCTHQLRQRALEAASDSWIEKSRNQFWSWGRCIVNAVQNSFEPIEISRVAAWVDAIVDAKPARWIEIPQELERMDAAERKRILTEMVESIEATARQAKIPRSLMMPKSLNVRLSEIPIEALTEALHLITALKVLQLLPANNVLDTVSNGAGEAIKDVANFFQKGTFGYPGLISEKLKTRDAPESRS